MIVNILVSLVGILIFLFVFWRRLKEDYSSEIIFSSAFLMILGVIFGVLVTSVTLPSWWFWGAVLGMSLGVAVSALKIKLRFYETLEACVLASLPWVILIFLTHSIVESSLFSLLFSVLTASLFLLFYYLNENYKDFTWYKSGRVGISGLFVLGVFFIIRALVSTFSPFVLSFVGKADTIISGAYAFIVFLLLYNLAKSER